MEIDILQLDEKIQAALQEERAKLPQYRKRLKELHETMRKTIPLRAKQDIRKNIEELQATIERLETSRDLNFYTVETAELLQKYKEILKKPVKVSFVGKAMTENKERDEIVKRYLEIAQNFLNVINVSVKGKEKKFRYTCDNCPNTKNYIVEENVYICTECWSQQDMLQPATSYRDSDRVNVSTKYTYDRRTHFRDCIQQYQGNQNCTISQKVYDDLEDIFERHHLLVGDKSTKREVRFSKITKEHILMFLKELGYPKQYENTTLIYYNLTGKKPDDISHLEERLLTDFDILVETYDKLFKNKVDRVNFISTHYVLYQLLQKYKYPCKKEDFMNLRTLERKVFHDQICRELFSHLGWNFTPIV